MNIARGFEDLKSWASQKDVLFVEGGFEQSRTAIVELPYKGEDSVEIFKQLIEKLSIKVIIYELVHLDAGTYEIFEETIEYLDDEDIKEKFEQLRNFENKCFGYTLHFFHNGMTFKINSKN